MCALPHIMTANVHMRTLTLDLFTKFRLSLTQGHEYNVTV